MMGLRFPLAYVRWGAGVRGMWRLVAAVGISLVLAGLVAGSAAGAPTLPVLWEAGGLDAGSTGAGQAARIASDPAGNVAVVSGPAVFSRPGGDVVHADRDTQVARDRVSFGRDVHR